ncbi:hypothetical protein GOP47_0021039 [Adiantum capillus-veneris]|uniref:Uncharacterized protein n=1 Tax=Adiantum capillus-veneris TaxID=13818 RepID=A0A9D4UAB5_ADICA|nr:hypothetical protein GOP47_0021039 [Adiantum capillus-veneris]
MLTCRSSGAGVKLGGEQGRHARVNTVRFCAARVKSSVLMVAQKTAWGFYATYKLGCSRM